MEGFRVLRGHLKSCTVPQHLMSDLEGSKFKVCSTSRSGTLHFILLQPIIVFFSQHMPIPSQPALL